MQRLTVRIKLAQRRLLQPQHQPIDQASHPVRRNPFDRRREV